MIKKIRDKLEGRVFLQALFVGLIGVTGAFLYNVSDLFLATKEELETLTSQYANELSSLLIWSSISTFILVFIAYFLGYKSRQRINIANNNVNKKIGFIAVIVTIVISVLLYILDYKVYYNNVNYFVPIVFNPVELLTNIVHSGTVEEIILRWGLTSFIIWMFYNIFSKRDDSGKKKPITKPIIISAVIFSTLLVFFFQLQEIVNFYSQSWLIFIRSFINYFCIGLLLNSIYVKYGLKWSIILHIIFIIVYTGICPIALYLFV